MVVYFNGLDKDPQVLLALDYCKKMHYHQQRRGSSEPYWFHPKRVSQTLARHGCGSDLVAAGLLHDVVEDTSATMESLACQGFTARTIELVMGVTKPDGVLSEVMIDRILKSGDRDLILLKYADNEDNMRVDYRHVWPGWEKAFLRYAEYRVALIKALRSFT